MNSLKIIFLRWSNNEIDDIKAKELLNNYLNFTDQEINNTMKGWKIAKKYL